MLRIAPRCFSWPAGLQAGHLGRPGGSVQHHGDGHQEVQWPPLRLCTLRTIGDSGPHGTSPHRVPGQETPWFLVVFVVALGRTLWMPRPATRQALPATADNLTRWPLRSPFQARVLHLGGDDPHRLRECERCARREALRVDLSPTQARSPGRAGGLAAARVPQSHKQRL